MESNYEYMLSSDNIKDLTGYCNDLNKLIEVLLNCSNEFVTEHSKNVFKYVTSFGEELNISAEDLELLKIGGLLHDIGKVCIPENILNKSDVLTNEEFNLIKKHSLLGETLLPSDCHEKIREIVRNHHERIDGRGYPDGIKGKDIPYLAKVISIVDAFDAMITKRPYGSVKTIEEALDELSKCSKPTVNSKGEIFQQLDSNLVEIFIRLIQKQPIDEEVYEDSVKPLKKVKK